MIILGIESTAHTFGVGVYDSKKDKVLTNQKSYYKPKNQGIVPRKAAEHHAKNAPKTIVNALKDANISMGDIGAIAYSAGPGLGPCLQTGATAAAFLSMKFDLPLIAINHPYAHIEIAKWQTKLQDPIILYVSGGNTQVIVEEKKKYRVLGETLDIGLGNLFDMFSRELGDEFGHGSVIAKKAKRAKKYHLLPYTIKGMNFAFSGLFTNAKNKIGDLDEDELCYSLMETAFCEVCEALERALMLRGKRQVIVCGGVAQNADLMQKVKIMAGAHGAKAATCDNEYNSDNGAMIAYGGYLQRKKTIEAKDVWTDQKWRIDQV